MDNMITIYDTMSFPVAEFGDSIKREVRLLVHPKTTAEPRGSIVHVTLPPGAVSEGHRHIDTDEYIYFDIGGRAVLDDIAYDVPPMGLVHARAGVKHECINTGNSTLTLLCIFLPPFEAYGKYPDLIEKTKKHLTQLKDNKEDFLDESSSNS